MDAIIGRYRVRIEENELVLTHPLGISFDLTLDETLALLNFINLYQQALIDAQHNTQHDTEPRLRRVVIEKHDMLDI